MAPDAVGRGRGGRSASLGVWRGSWERRREGKAQEGRRRRGICAHLAALARHIACPHRHISAAGPEVDSLRYNTTHLSTQGGPARRQNLASAGSGEECTAASEVSTQEEVAVRPVHPCAAARHAPLRAMQRPFMCVCTWR